MRGKDGAAARGWERFGGAGVWTTPAWSAKPPQWAARKVALGMGTGGDTRPESRLIEKKRTYGYGIGGVIQTVEILFVRTTENIQVFEIFF